MVLRARRNNGENTHDDPPSDLVGLSCQVKYVRADAEVLGLGLVCFFLDMASLEIAEKLESLASKPFAETENKD